MGKPTPRPFLRRHRLAFQSAALVAMLAVPVGLYWAAQAQSLVGILAGLALLGAAMALALALS